MDVTLNGEKAIVTSTHFSEGIRNKIRFWKVIRMAENVRECKGVGGEETVAIDEAAVGEGVTILVCPGVKDIVVLLIDDLGEVSDEKRGRRRRRKKAERGAETGYDEDEERPEEVEGENPGEEETVREDGE
jgi:hypothetical protein